MQIQAAALSSSTQQKNPDYAKVFLSSLADKTDITAVLKSLGRVVAENGVQAEICPTGSFGYYDLEPLLLVEKPGQPVIWYPAVTPASAAEIIREYLIKSNPIPQKALCSMGRVKIDGLPDSSELRLFSLQNRVALRNCGYIDPENIYDYILRAGGYSGLDRVTGMPPKEVLRELRESGLRDTSCEYDLTAERWTACLKAAGSKKYVICNAVDADPQVVTSRLLLESDPHSIIEGMLIAAYTIGASQCIIAVDNRYRYAINRLVKALKQAKNAGLSGERILDTGFNTEIQVKELETCLVLTEDTALLSALDGQPAMPYINPPFPSSAGLRNQLALIENIETFSRVSAVFQASSKRFFAGPINKGWTSKIVTLTGTVIHQYTIEVPLGTSIGDIVNDVGGGALDGKTIKAIQFGGPAGAFIKCESPDTFIDFESMQQAGAASGAGTLEIISGNPCALEMALKAISIVHEGSCGKCVFCREGTYQMAFILGEILKNRAGLEDLVVLRELGEYMKLGSLCRIGRMAPNPVLSNLKLFEDDFVTHTQEKRCPEGATGDKGNRQA